MAAIEPVDEIKECLCVSIEVLLDLGKMTDFTRTWMVLITVCVRLDRINLQQLTFPWKLQIF